MSLEDLNKKELKEKLRELREDIDEVEETAKDNKSDFNPLIRQKWRKWNKVIIGLVGGIVLLLVGYKVEIPEPAIVIGIGMVVTAIVAYPFAERVADYFIEDNRMPIIGQSPMSPYEVEGYKIPRDRATEIEVLEGEKMSLETDVMGHGYQVEDFTALRGKNNKQHLVAKGIRGGMKPNWIKANLTQWYNIRNVLYPRSQKLQAYERNMPVIFHQVENEAVTKVAREFEKLAVHGNEDYREVTDNDIEMGYSEETDSDTPEYDEQVQHYLEDMEEMGEF